MAKTRKMRRSTRRLRKMRGRGFFNKARNLAASAKNYGTRGLATAKNYGTRGLNAVTPSQAKLNYMRNKVGKAANVTRSATQMVKNTAGRAYAALPSVKMPSMKGNTYTKAQLATSGFSLPNLSSFSFS